jgi:hypothetical protein
MVPRRIRLLDVEAPHEPAVRCPPFRVPGTAPIGSGDTEPTGPAQGPKERCAKRGGSPASRLPLVIHVGRSCRRSPISDGREATPPPPAIPMTDFTPRRTRTKPTAGLLCGTCLYAVALCLPVPAALHQELPNEARLRPTWGFNFMKRRAPFSPSPPAPHSVESLKPGGRESAENLIC